MVDFHTGHVGELRWSSFYSDAHSAGLIKWSYNPYPFGVDPVWHGSRSELPFLNSMKMKMSILMGITQMNLGVILSWWNAKFFHNKLDIWWGTMVWLVWRLRLGKFCFHNNTKASQLKLVHNDTESKSCNQEKKGIWGREWSVLLGLFVAGTNLFLSCCSSTLCLDTFQYLFS